MDENITRAVLTLAVTWSEQAGREKARANRLGNCNAGREAFGEAGVLLKCARELIAAVAPDTEPEEYDHSRAKEDARNAWLDQDGDPAAQAERDRLMPQACRAYGGEGCGGEVPEDGAEPDHLPGCPEAVPDLPARDRH